MASTFSLVLRHARKLSSAAAVKGGGTQLPPVVVFTGAAGDVGKVSVHKLLAEGKRVAMVDRPGSGVVDLAKVLAAQFPHEAGRPTSVLGLEVDVTDSKAVEELMAKVNGHFGSVDQLVNVAGLYVKANLMDTPEDVYDRVMGVNVKGAYLTMKSAYPYMLKSHDPAVLNLASIAEEGVAGEGVYSVSKSALSLMTKVVFWESRGSGIRYSVLSPPPIRGTMCLNRGMNEDHLIQPSTIAQWISNTLNTSPEATILHQIMYNTRSPHPLY